MQAIIDALKNRDIDRLQAYLTDVTYLIDAENKKHYQNRDILAVLLPLLDKPYVITTFGRLIFFAFEDYLMKWHINKETVQYIFIHKNDAQLRRIKIDFSYDGSHYRGFQKQVKTSNTIQQQLENVLAHLFKNQPTIQAAGRTDKGVHAHHQVAHVDIDSDLDTHKIIRLMNKMLPKDIHIHDCEDISPLFHARFDVYQKVYRYVMLKEKDPLMSHYSHYTGHLDLSNLNEIFKPLIGSHDFLSFSKFEPQKPTIKTIDNIEIKETKQAYYIDVQGKGFLRQMVRIIIGNALYDLRNKTNLTLRGIQTPSKNASKHLAPSEGLYLHKLYY